MRACRKCQGRGRIPDKIDGKPVIRRCDMCNGNGVNLKNKCKVCDGSRTAFEEHNVTFMIPVGVTDGEEFIVKNQGNIIIGNNTRDNVVFTVRYDNDSIFKTNKQCPNIVGMESRDLCVAKSISLASSLCNKPVNVELLNGDKRELCIDHIIKPNDIVIIENAGLPEHGNPTKCGRLFIVFKIAYPKCIPNDKVNTLFELLNSLETDPDGK
jgi:molecular chaperone DnaJ